jgi:hypothetical protein
VVRGRLWRMSDPTLGEEVRAALVSELMVARRNVGAAPLAGDDDALGQARHRVDIAKRRLGERGSVWWADGAPDLNRQMARNTIYEDWFAAKKTPPMRPGLVASGLAIVEALKGAANASAGKLQASA